MTYGSSRTVEEFLKAAGKKRKFEVIVAEAFPSYYNHMFVLILQSKRATVGSFSFKEWH